MEKDWIKIKIYTNPLEAEIVKQMLEENGIAAVLLNKQDSSYLIGKLELYVSEDQKAAALELINNETNIEVEEDDVN